MTLRRQPWVFDIDTTCLLSEFKDAGVAGDGAVLVVG